MGMIRPPPDLSGHDGQRQNCAPCHAQGPGHGGHSLGYRADGDRRREDHRLQRNVGSQVSGLSCSVGIGDCERIQRRVQFLRHLHSSHESSIPLRRAHRRDCGDDAHRRARGGGIHRLHRQERESPRRLDSDLRPGSGVLRPDDGVACLRLCRRPSLRSDRPHLRLHRHEFSGCRIPQASSVCSSSSEERPLRSSKPLNERDPATWFIGLFSSKIFLGKVNDTFLLRF